MRQDQIKVGNFYEATVSGKNVMVQVEKIDYVGDGMRVGGHGRRGRRNSLAYRVVEVITRKKHTFKSAAPFQREVAGPTPQVDPADVALASASAAAQEVIENSQQEGEQRSDPLIDARPAANHSSTSDDTKCASTSRTELPDAHRQFQSSSETTESGTSASLASKLAVSLKRRKRGTPVAGMVPNEEQESILEVAVSLQMENKCGQVLVINAGAGTGKTSTDRMLEQELRGSGQYTAFNKALVEESRTKFVKAAVNTTYALAFRAVGKDYQHRLGGDRVKSWQVAKQLGMGDLTLVVKGRGAPLVEGSDGWEKYAAGNGYLEIPPNEEGEALMKKFNEDPSNDANRAVFADWLEENVSADHAEFVRNPCGDLVRTLKADFLAGQVRETLRRFSQSADPVEYISDHIWHPTISSLGDEARRQFREYLIPFVRKAWEDVNKVDGTFPFDHIFYVKMWQLGVGEKRPVIAADYILLDEAQDTPPVFLDILKKQTHALLVLVGDDNQQIYEFLGAVNAMASFKGAPRRLLSQSYRFGQVGADVANAILETLEEPTDLVMRGNPCIPSRVCKMERPRCWIYRTNGGAVGRVMQEFQAGRNVHLIGGGKDTVDWCRAALDLQQKRRTSHYDLCCFESWQDVEEYSKTDEGADLKLMVKLVNQFGAEAIIDALRDMPKEVDADVVVCTAHKSKGREWESVKLGQDFPTLNRMGDSERRLLYVAATRFTLNLDVSECPPFCGGQERDGGEDGSGVTRFVPGLEINYTVDMPTEEEQAEWVAAKMEAKSAATVQPKPTPNGSAVVVSREQGKEAQRTTHPGKFTWTKHNDVWCARGPGDVVVGTAITVVTRDGKEASRTVKEVLKRYGDVWVYAV